MNGYFRKEFLWVNWVFKEAFVIQDEIYDENIWEIRGDKAEQLPLHCSMAWNLVLDLSCLSLSLLLSKYSQTAEDFFFSFGWEIKVRFVSCCEGRVHHLQRIMGFFKKGKTAILLAWRLGKPFSMVKMHVLRRAVGESPFVLSLTQCWCFCRGAGQEHCSWCLAWLAIPGQALGCISPPPDQRPFLAHMWGCEASFSEEGLAAPGGVRSGYSAVCFIDTEGSFLNPPILGNYTKWGNKSEPLQCSVSVMI